LLGDKEIETNRINVKRSPLIVFDGPNGAGKSTIIKSVADQLEEEEIKCCLTKEPTKSELGTFIHSSQNLYSKEVLACMVAANRYEHLDTIIKPGIEKGCLVISDRYYPSSLVYQRMDGLDIGFIESLNQRIVVPDLTIILTASEKTLKHRLALRDQITRFEKDQSRELELYSEASEILMERGWNLITLNTDLLTVLEATTRIMHEIRKSISN